MTMSIHLDRKETLKLADYLGIGRLSIESTEITSLSVYGSRQEKGEEVKESE